MERIATDRQRLVVEKGLIRYQLKALLAEPADYLRINPMLLLLHFGD
jgi:hypothetical protein